jgi:DNA-3-methyladenine glycosylase
VAADLLGSRVSGGDVVVELTEVEAYAGEADPASHAYRGRTPRNAVMYGPGGRVYVYLSYGMHHCVNLVCGQPGTASAVLLRAGRVVSGLGGARERRGDVADAALARGPGNLAKTLGATLRATGTTVWDGPLRWTPAPGTRAFRSGPRVGVSQAADVAWRLWLDGEASVSTYRRHPKAL